MKKQGEFSLSTGFSVKLYGCGFNIFKFNNKSIATPVLRDMKKFSDNILHTYTYLHFEFASRILNYKLHV